jgi:sulfur carrier protein
MKLYVNGKKLQYSGQASLSALLRKMGADPKRVAVVVNDGVVPAPKRAKFRLSDGDRVEILSFAGGG